MKTISRQRRDELIDALRRGTVPMQSLDLLAVGLDHFAGTLGEELEAIKAGGAKFKAVRGEYGTGKTFFSRWLAERARQMGFATSEVQISETETPLHRLETVYRRLMERLGTPDTPTGALRNILDGWFFTLEEDVLAEGNISPSDHGQLLERSNALMEKRLAVVTQSAPMFAVALRGYHTARATGDAALADGIAAWLAGQPNVAASSKRQVGVKGDIDHFGAMSFLQGLLTVLRDSGHAGLYLVLDEVETIQRVRGDVRDKSLNALRQLIDDIDSGRFPGLYLLITGTQRLLRWAAGRAATGALGPAAARRFSDRRPLRQPPGRPDPPAWLRPRPALPGRLQGPRHFPAARQGRRSESRRRATTATSGSLAEAVTGRLGGKVGVAPRIFLKKLVADVLDRIDQFPDFNPRQHYALTIAETELTPVERQAMGASDVDEIELNL